MVLNPEIRTQIPPEFHPKIDRDPFAQFQKTLEIIKSRDEINPKIKELDKRFDHDALGRKAEDFYLNVLKRYEQVGHFNIQKAPQSLDYFYPNIDLVMQLDRDKIVGIQLFSDIQQNTDKKQKASILFDKYWPTILFGKKILPGFPPNSPEATIGFVPIDIDSETGDAIQFWQPGLRIDQPNFHAGDFLKKLSTSLDPNNRDKLINGLLAAGPTKLSHSEVLKAQQQLKSQYRHFLELSEGIAQLSRQVGSGRS